MVMLFLEASMREDETFHNAGIPYRAFSHFVPCVGATQVRIGFLKGSHTSIIAGFPTIIKEGSTET